MKKLIVRNITIPAGEDFFEALPLSLEKKGIKKYNFVSVLRSSLDARRAPEINFIYSVIVEAEGIPRHNDVSEYTQRRREVRIGSTPLKSRPVVVGYGPAGMFAAYGLALYGYRPIVIERGSDVDTRSKEVSDFWQRGEVNEDSNVQFGEGGAGTFSDGKLITRVNDPLTAFVMETFVEFGAEEKIKYEARPHIGTDKLRTIVKNIRLRTQQLGADIRFNTRLDYIEKYKDGYRLTLSDKSELFTEKIFLAIGHSATDTFRSLMKSGVTISPKDFSVGVRIEHKRRDVERALYRSALDKEWAARLPAAEYNLSAKINGRGVYSFCMCPGGVVVPSCFKRGTVVTNGMSYHARNGENSNSAVNVSVTRSDYGNSPEKAILFLEEIEKNAFILGGGDYKAPCQTVGAFLEGRVDRAFDKLPPTYSRGVTPCDLSLGLPSFVSDTLKGGLSAFAKRLSFFSNTEAPLTGYETRTSSPIRIDRIDSGESVSHSGIYPCGEGAGYAGGITSASIDGYKAALKFISEFAPPQSK